MKAVIAQKFSSPIRAWAIFCVVVWLAGTVVTAMAPSNACCDAPAISSCGCCPPRSVGGCLDPHQFDGLQPLSLGQPLPQLFHPLFPVGSESHLVVPVAFDAVLALTQLEWSLTPAMRLGPGIRGLAPPVRA